MTTSLNHRQVRFLTNWIDFGADPETIYDVADAVGGEVWHAACRMTPRAFTAHVRTLLGMVTTDVVCSSPSCGGSGDELPHPDAPLCPACPVCDGLGVVVAPDMAEVMAGVRLGQPA